MDKKDLKWYESPVSEVVEVEIEGFLCASAGTSGGSDDIDPEDVHGGFGS